MDNNSEEENVAPELHDEEHWLYGEGEGAGPVVEETTPVKEPEDEQTVRSDHTNENEEQELQHDEQPAPPGETNEEAEQEGKEEEEEENADEADESSENVAYQSMTETNGEVRTQDDVEEGEDDSDDSDDVHVTIGDIKTTSGYERIGISRKSGLLPGEKHKSHGKFSIEEFESIGIINGVAAHEYSIDALEDKPWRKPGADITDYFNYGFNEETWRAYCERQKTMRIQESGVGLGALGMPRVGVNSISLINDNSKYTPMGGVGSNPNVLVVAGANQPTIRNKLTPQPVTRRPGMIDVIGGQTVASRRTESPPKENAIQTHSLYFQSPNSIPLLIPLELLEVMTADKRDYGRKGFDVSIPPPNFDMAVPPPGGFPMTNYAPDPFYPEVDPYYQQYDMPPVGMEWQGSHNQSRRSRRLKSHSLYPQSPNSIPPLIPPELLEDLVKESSLTDGIVIKQEPADRPAKERDRERERHRDKERHRHRSRTRSSERRTKRHKSRSRSPSHRSHKKKKSKKSDRRSRERSRDRDRERDRERERERSIRENDHSREKSREREKSRDRENKSKTSEESIDKK